MFSLKQRRLRYTAGSVLVVGAVTAATVASGVFADASGAIDNSLATTTPIKHVVVLFSENVSFDHYFATYPNAANGATDSIKFNASPSTPTDIDTEANATKSGTSTGSKGYLLTDANPNNAVWGQYPHRLALSQALTTSQGHGYLQEQQAVNNGAMDNFTKTRSGTTAITNGTSATTGYTYSSPDIVLDYYDGNTVTGLWNYAQNYAMSDNSWDANFGPSTVGAINLISGETGGSKVYTRSADGTLTESASGGSNVSSVDPNTHVGTTTGDPTPAYDDCADTSVFTSQQGKNVGDLLNAKHVTWGWFQGGFTPTTPYNGTGTLAACNSTTPGLDGEVAAYSPHHNPFEYYASTANPHHVAPKNVQEVGHDGQANHEYDLSYFQEALDSGNLPAVSYLKAPRAQDGHPGNSDPLDEQQFFVDEINAIQQSKYWSNTAIVISYDDSDGWYDHVAPTITNSSNNTSADSQHDDAICTNAAAAGVPALANEPSRCGPSQRLPLLVISPYAKQNYVDHTLTNQASILKFVEDNWSTGRIGGGSFDATAGSLNSFFDWQAPQQRSVILNGDGSVQSINPVTVKSSSVTKLSIDKPTQTYGSNPATLTAKVSGDAGTAKGSVRFYDGVTVLATKSLSNGAASYTLPKNLSVGRHWLTAAYVPSGSAARSYSQPVQLLVTKAKPKPQPHNPPKPHGGSHKPGKH